MSWFNEGGCIRYKTWLSVSKTAKWRTHLDIFNLGSNQQAARPPKLKLILLYGDWQQQSVDHVNSQEQGWSLQIVFLWQSHNSSSNKFISNNRINTAQGKPIADDIFLTSTTSVSQSIRVRRIAFVNSDCLMLISTQSSIEQTKRRYNNKHTFTNQRNNNGRWEIKARNDQMLILMASKAKIIH